MQGYLFKLRRMYKKIGFLSVKYIILCSQNQGYTGNIKRPSKLLRWAIFQKELKAFICSLFSRKVPSISLKFPYL